MPDQKKLIAICGLALILGLFLAFFLPSVISPNPSVSKLQGAMMDRDWERAWKLSSQLLKTEPDQALIHLLAGQCAQNLGKHEDARKHYREAARLDEALRPDLSIAIATSYEAEGRMDESIECLSKSKGVHPSLEVERYLADTLNIVGRRFEGSQIQWDLLRAQRWSVETLRDLGNIGRTVMKSKDVSSLLIKSPQDKNLRVSYARCLREEGNFKESLEILTDVLRIDRNSIEAQAQLGLLLDAYRPDLLVDWVRKVPDHLSHPDIWWIQGKLSLAKNNRDYAERCFAEALELMPGHLGALIGLAECYRVESREEEYRTILERVRLTESLLRTLDELLTDQRYGPNLVDVVQKLKLLGRISESKAWLDYGLSAVPQDRSLSELKRQFANDTSASANWIVRIVDIEKLRGRPAPTWESPNANSSSEASNLGIEAPDELLNPYRLVLELPFEHSLMKHATGKAGRKMFEMTGGGIGVIDYDRDGQLDLFLSQGGENPADRSQAACDCLLRRSSSGFQEVTQFARIHDSLYGQGVGVGDVNNDGFDDIYVGNIGPNQLWLNQGDGTFTDGQPLLNGQTSDWTTSVAIADLNLDGTPELIDGNYVHGPDVFTKLCNAQGLPRICSPLHFTLSPPSLWIWDGNEYRKATEKHLELQPSMGNTLGILVYKNPMQDSLNVFLANDQTANSLLVAEASTDEGFSLKYTDQSIVNGIAFDAAGRAQACMGVAAGDCNSDGLTDILVTNFENESNTLYVQRSDGSFADLTGQSGLVAPSKPMLGFGAQFADYNSDGSEDLLVLNGHIDDYTPLGGSHRMPAQLFRGQGDGSFQLVPTRGADKFFQSGRLGRALAKIDWDQDGLVDFVAADLEKPYCILQNQSPKDDACGLMVVLLVGVESSRDAIGTIVQIRTDRTTYSKQNYGGHGYMVSNDRSIHFAIPSKSEIEEVELLWPSGKRDIYRAQPFVNSMWLCVEGQGIYKIQDYQSGK